MNIAVIPPVVETRIVEVAPAKVQLELSVEEASFITAVLGRLAISVDAFHLYDQLYNQVIGKNAELRKKHRDLAVSLTGVISIRR